MRIAKRRISNTPATVPRLRRLAGAATLGSVVALCYSGIARGGFDVAVAIGMFIVATASYVVVADFAHTGAGEGSATDTGTESVAFRHHSALRRATSLIAQGASPTEVFSLLAEDLVRCPTVDIAAMFRFDADGSVVLVGRHVAQSADDLLRRLILDGDAATVPQLGSTSGSMEGYGSAAGAVAAHLRRLSVHSPVVAPIVVDDTVWGLLVAGSSRDRANRQNAGFALGDCADLVATTIGIAAARKELQAGREGLDVLVTQQQALRRLATMVAGGVSPDECFAAVAEEMANCLGVDKAEVFRYEDDGAAVAVACQVISGIAHLAVGEPIASDDHKIATELLRSGFASITGRGVSTPVAVRERLRDLGVGSLAGAPIVVDGRLWGMAVVGSNESTTLPLDTKDRIAEFADLVAAYIAASTTRAELIASRARMVAAADQARRRLERDLHDGAQQRLVSMQLKLRATATDVPDELTGLKAELADLAADLTEVTKELQQISRGIHPAVLSKGGLVPALKALANRSAIPTTANIAVGGSLSQPVEVAAYYIVAEALTNAAKHSHATHVSVTAYDDDTTLHLSVSDNGIGGAIAGKGSGLTGLDDRVKGLGGMLTITSIAGTGTSLDVTIPIRELRSGLSSEEQRGSVLLAR
jgi:signal transduction histidine kinase